MSLEKVYQLVEERLEAEWAGQTPIAWDNMEYIPKRGEDFIRLAITQTLSELTTAAEYGSGNYREHGLITVQVFTQKNKGARDNIKLSDQVANIFRGYTEERLFIHETRITRIGQREEWYQSNVLIDYYYDNCLELA
jgi:hypothetical protein